MNWKTALHNKKMQKCRLLICCVRDFCVAGALCIFARDIFTRNNSENKISTKFANGFENIHKV
jgi:hypothetical protein